MAVGQIPDTDCRILHQFTVAQLQHARKVTPADVAHFVRLRADFLIHRHVLRLPTVGLARAGEHQFQTDEGVLLAQFQNGLRRHGIKPERAARAEMRCPRLNLM